MVPRDQVPRNEGQAALSAGEGFVGVQLTVRNVYCVS